MEKVMTYLILLFILLLAAFNVASSLAMLLIEKQDDSRILHRSSVHRPASRSRSSAVWAY